MSSCAGGVRVSATSSFVELPSAFRIITVMPTAKKKIDGR